MQYVEKGKEKRKKKKRCKIVVFILIKEVNLRLDKSVLGGVGSCFQSGISSARNNY